MAGNAADYHKGEMDIVEQSATFRAFIGLTKWGSLSLCVGILFFSLWLCAHAGFFQSLAAAIVLLVVGVIVLRDKPNAGH